MRWFGKEEDVRDVGQFMAESIGRAEPVYVPATPSGKTYRGLAMIHQNLELLSEPGKSQFNISAEARHARILLDLWRKNFSQIERFIR